MRVIFISIRVNDSSAFEHVFIGEKNEEGTIGCHSWIQYYLLEKRKLTDYYGYIPNKCQVSFMLLILLLQLVFILLSKVLFSIQKIRVNQK